MKFLEVVKSHFHPSQYSKEIYCDEEELCLMRRKGLGKYVLYTKAYDPSKNLQVQLSEVRKRVRKLTGALWLLNEVGVYVILTCKQLPKVSSRELEVDCTGFHSVIIQGVHLVAPLEGKHIVNVARWGDRTFGDADKISAEIVQLMA